MRSYPPFAAVGLSASAFAVAAALCITASHWAPTQEPIAYANGIKGPALAFESNRGQAHSNVKYLSRGPGYTMLLAGKEAVIRLSRQEAGAAKQATVKMTLAGARNSPKVLSRSKGTGVVNYFLGNDPKKWLTGVPTYPRVAFGEVYPNIDVEYYGRQGQLEYDFQVRPRGDPSQIRMSLEGVSSASVDNNGDLRMETEAGTLVQERPLLYQIVDGSRRAVSGGYVLARNSTGSPEVGFEVAAYDPTLTLVIDPVLVYSSYLGGAAGAGGVGTGADDGQAIAVASDGSACVAGTTASSTFPTENPFQPNHSMGSHFSEVFVTKFAPNGESLVFSTYLGGIGWESVGGIVVDESGNIHVAGSTDSTNFPLKNQFQTLPTNSSTVNAFVTMIASDGALLYSTYMGGSGADFGTALAYAGSGKVIITGTTDSEDFPTTLNALDTDHSGTWDVHVAKFDPTKAGAASLVYSTFLGETGRDFEVAIDADTDGNAYVAGNLIGDGFPTTPGAFDRTFKGGVFDVFVSKVSADGRALMYSTVLGSSGEEFCRGIAVDSGGNAYVVGVTESGSFPTTTGAFDKTYNGQDDTFVTKLNANGSQLVYSTFFGGSGNDVPSSGAVYVDGDGNAYLAGRTSSTDFPLMAPFQQTHAGSDDGFVCKLNADGNELIYTSYIGGPDSDEASGVAVDDAGHCYVTGWTSSATGFPITTRAFQPVINGAGDAWVAKIEAAALPLRAPTNLIATTLSSDQVLLEWSDGSADEDSFEVQRNDGLASGSDFSTIGAVGSNVTEFMDKGLAPQTTYSYRVRALNATGASTFSNVATATTLSSPPEGPSDLVATGIASNSVKLTWRDNGTNELRFRIERSNNGASFAIAGTVGANVTQFTVTGLVPSTLYHFRVRAENSGGNSAFSNVASATTFPPPPAAPNDLTAVAESYASVRLQWNDNSANELEFQIYRSGAAGDFVQVGTSRMDVPTFTNTGLIAETVYRYKVCAANEGGASAFSAIVKVKTLVTPPARPTGLLAGVGSDGVILNWSDESEDETAFNVQRALIPPPNPMAPPVDPDFAVIASLPANATTYQDATARPDSRYRYRVLAAKGISLSLPSNTVEVITVPAAPGGLSATEIDRTSLLLKWLDKSSTEAGFRIEKKIGGKTATGNFALVTTVSPGATSFRVGGLNPDTLYTFRVGALSSGNALNFSALLEVRTLAEVPAAPADLKAAGVSSTAIKLEWLDKSGNEKRFEIQRSGGDETFVPLAEVGTNVKTYTDVGLEPESLHTYRVRAVNDGGPSPFSNTATGRTFPAPPGAPTRLVVADPTANSFKITWRDEGGKATGFELERKTGSGAFAKAASPGADARQFVDGGLAPNTAYKYRIRGKNAGGFSPYSDEAGGLTLAAAPRELIAAAGGPRTIDLKWKAGSTSAGYAIERRSQEENSFRRISTVGGASTTFSDQNLPAGAKMTYRVRAFNGSGESQPSNEASALTEVAVQSLTLTPSEVRGGRKVRGKVTLSGPAPAGGLVIKLASSKQRKAATPNSVTARAEATTVEFNVETDKVRRETVVTLSAEAKGTKKEALLKLKK